MSWKKSWILWIILMKMILEIFYGVEYITKKAYNALIGTHPTKKCILDIWKTCCLTKHNFFAWLMMNGKINTKDMMKRKNFYVEFYDCILCDTCLEESIFHIFFDCNFRQSFWWAMGIEWNSDMDLNSMIQDAKQRYSMTFIMEILITSCWSLWDQRNSYIFRERIPTLNSSLSHFKNSDRKSVV